MTAAVERPTAVVNVAAGPVEYRLERRDEAAVVVFHGGHMRAGLALGEEVFAECGYTVLVPSRPGYGRTPLSTGTSPGGFADVTRELCRHLGIDRVAAVVGISGGGHTAVSMAARHPGLVSGLILESAVGFLPWPDRLTRVGGQVVFDSVIEGVTWGGMRALLRVSPGLGLRALLGGLSTEPVERVLAALSAEDRATLVALFSRMRSCHGFRNDLRAMTEEFSVDVTAEVTQPALVIASRRDGAVPFAHAESLAASLPHAELVASEAMTHFLWFGDDYPGIADKIRRFLADGCSE